MYPGGLSGLTILIQDIFGKFLGIPIPYGRLYLLLNLPTVWLGFRKIGKKFTLYTLITIATVTVLTELIPPYTITADPLLISVFGGIINGAAIAVALAAGATTGGTDFVSIYLTENSPVDGFSVILGFLLLIYSIVMKVRYGAPAGYTTLIVVMCFMFAILFILVGIIGQYIGVLFQEIKGRPIYLIEETMNFGPVPGEESGTEE